MFTLLSVWFGAQLCILFHINEYSSIVSNFIEEIGQHIFIKLCLQTKWLTGLLFHSIKMHIVHVEGLYFDDQCLPVTGVP